MTDTAIITGGAGGIGLATAHLLGADHRIVVADVREERLDDAVRELRAAGIDADGRICDVTDRRSVDALIAGAGTHVRALVHAAGVSPQMGDAAFIARVNAAGTVNVAQSYLRVAGEGDVLVNVGSVAGYMVPAPLQPTWAFRHSDPATLTRAITRTTCVLPEAARPAASYCTSKAFVIWYTSRLAAAFGEKGARTVSVSPGSVDTELGRLEEQSGSGRLIDYAAFQRFGEPSEVAEVLAFAAGRKPGYLTGTDILVDGGARAGLGLKDVLSLARRL